MNRTSGECGVVVKSTPQSDTHKSNYNVHFCTIKYLNVCGGF